MKLYRFCDPGGPKQAALITGRRIAHLRWHFLLGCKWYRQNNMAAIDQLFDLLCTSGHLLGVDHVDRYEQRIQGTLRDVKEALFCRSIDEIVPPFDECIDSPVDPPPHEEEVAHYVEGRVTEVRQAISRELGQHLQGIALVDVGLRIEELCCPPDLHRHVRNPGLFVRADHKAANSVPQLDADFTLGMGNVPPTYGWNTRLAAAVHSAGIPENLLTELIDTSRQAFAGGFDVVATANAMTETILHWLANPTDDGSFARLANGYLGLKLDFDGHVSRNQRSLHISQQPMGLLAKLVAVYGREVPYERLLPPEKERGWLHTLVSRLNDSLMTLGVTVENVQGFGYRLVEATP